jgi:hypothetical protein
LHRAEVAELRGRLGAAARAEIAKVGAQLRGGLDEEEQAAETAAAVQQQQQLRSELGEELTQARALAEVCAQTPLYDNILSINTCLPRDEVV